jgi:hypothetical protein
MKADVILNGSIRVVLIPETDIEKLALEQIAKTEITTVLIDKQTQILDKIVHHALVMQPKSSTKPREEDA